MAKFFICDADFLPKLVGIAVVASGRGFEVVPGVRGWALPVGESKDVGVPRSYPPGDAGKFDQQCADRSQGIVTQTFAITVSFGLDDSGDLGGHAEHLVVVGDESVRPGLVDGDDQRSVIEFLHSSVNAFRWARRTVDGR